MKITFYLLTALLILASCAEKKTAAAYELLPQENFAKVVDGKEINLYTLTNDNGVAVQFTNFGARFVALWVPDRDENMQNVLWGYDNIDDYLTTTSIYSGPIVGRYGNRIGKGKFSLDGKDYQLTINDGVNHLHGGTNGFSTFVWDAEEIEIDGKKAIKMTHISPDGEEGYPGTVTLSVTYTLDDENGVHIMYKATTDAPTIINPTSHPYINLTGTTKNTILDHVLVINSDAFTPTDAGLIPTGEIASVEGTPMDFRTPTAIGERINQDYEPLVFGKGYDHNYIVNKAEGEMAEAAVVYSPKTGIRMTVISDQPAIQFYSGNFWDGTTTGHRGDVDTYRSAIALESQNYPDAPNHDNFPSSVLRPGETYTQHTIYKFDVKK